MADYHLQVKPGRDAWCLLALVGVLFEQELIAKDWLASHSRGLEDIRPFFESLNIDEYATFSGVDPQVLREVASVIAKANSFAAMEDLGLQQNVNSTLNSYLKNLLFVLTGNFAKKGGMNTPIPFFSLSAGSRGSVSGKGGGKRKKKATSPVTDSRIVMGSIPAVVIPDEILTDHPDRFRSMLIVSSNPVHSLANSERMRQAMRALEFSVVVDVAMTETARQADYVLPASNQFEKAESTFFNVEYPRNAFHVRQPLFSPLEGTLSEAEIFARLVEKAGSLSEDRHYKWLRRALKLNRAVFAAVLAAMIAREKHLMDSLPIMLYRTFGQTLPKGSETAAVIWAFSHVYRMNQKEYAANAGYTGLKGAERLFSDLMTKDTAVEFCDAGSYSESFNLMGTEGKKINLHLPELLEKIAPLAKMEPRINDKYPFFLAAGERRAETSNTIIRNPGWDRKSQIGVLRMSRADAEELGVSSDDRVVVKTRFGEVEASVSVSPMMAKGNISLPNGSGLDYLDENGEINRYGPSINELTGNIDRDSLAGTPNYKSVPAQVIPVNDKQPSQVALG
ncbi:molybdopterin dinucleotide binding domain-containing protein [Veronia nyctiphanis]|uniref:molybdopterin dinucleotide binding domain-containing protein n=1 Tax=Veronia nyctiphanis TaxID=1278244 RepID=UPI00191C326B|nr:molybdopterin dinucleotide binding domain-containing protein [Veronia nyctiphanis]